ARRVDHPRSASAHFCSRSTGPLLDERPPGLDHYWSLALPMPFEPGNASLDQWDQYSSRGGPVLVEPRWAAVEPGNSSVELGWLYAEPLRLHRKRQSHAGRFTWVPR